MQQKVTFATCEDTLVYIVDPGRRITPGACKQFRIVSGPANARNLNFIPKGPKQWFWMKRAENGPRRAKQCAFSKKMVVFMSQKINFRSNWPWSLQECLEPASAATLLPVILQWGSSPCQCLTIHSLNLFSEISLM